MEGCVLSASELTDTARHSRERDVSSPCLPAGFGRAFFWFDVDNPEKPPPPLCPSLPLLRHMPPAAVFLAQVAVSFARV